jgi:hypothetical protein
MENAHVIPHENPLLPHGRAAPVVDSPIRRGADIGEDSPDPVGVVERAAKYHCGDTTGLHGYKGASTDYAGLRRGEKGRGEVPRAIAKSGVFNR